LEDRARAGGIYEVLKTYLCRPVGGTPAPGYEPEPEASSVYAITEVKWFDLENEKSWDPLMTSDEITYPQFFALREAYAALRG